MSYRPYFRASIDDLELLFKEAKNGEDLAKIRDELQFRTTQRALNLLRKVEDAIRAKELKTPASVHATGATKSVSPENPRSHQLPKSEPAQLDNALISVAPSDEQRAGARSETPVPTSRDSISAKDGKSTSESELRTAPSEKAPTENHARLIDLLAYLEHLAKLGEKPVFALKDYQQLAFLEAELKGHIGITHDVSSDEGPTWLRIERLQRTDPPPLPQELLDWVVLSRDPYQAPKIQNILTR